MVNQPLVTVPAVIRRYFIAPSGVVKGQRRSPMISAHGRTVNIPPSRLAEKCNVYGKLILRKIIEIVATSCHIIKLKITKSDFGLAGP